MWYYTIRCTILAESKDHRYHQKSTPKRGTAVLICIDQSPTNSCMCRIEKGDGIKKPCAKQFVLNTMDDKKEPGRTILIRNMNNGTTKQSKSSKFLGRKDIRDPGMKSE